MKEKGKETLSVSLKKSAALQTWVSIMSLRNLTDHGCIDRCHWLATNKRWLQACVSANEHTFLLCFCPRNHLLNIDV